jgi:protein-disulfide isomerase
MEDHVRGNPQAATVLVEYADFECPYCGMAYPYVKRLAGRYPTDLAEVYRPFPLAEVHPHAMHAAQAAEAAGMQGKFWEMYDILFQHQQHLDDDSLLRYAEQLDLDMDRFRKDFGSTEVLERIKQSIQQGLNDGVQGTPSFFLNGAMLSLASYHELETAVAEAIARATSSSTR